ncbi:MAG: group II intron maturase-specific domain-containing protein [Rhodomicrobium sp.]
MQLYQRKERIFAHSFQPAASPKALTRTGREIRRWALHHRSDKSLTDLADIYNPVIRGWIVYDGNFYRTQLRPTSYTKADIDPHATGGAESIAGHVY